MLLGTLLENLGILPLLTTIIAHQSSSLLEVAFADDLTGVGRVKSLRCWWGEIDTHGPSIGYYAKASKSWLIVKPEFEEHARRAFSDTSINITTEGRRHLGACVGTAQFKESYIENKVTDWCKELKNLTEIAKFDPHSAYAAFTHGLRGRYVYFMRTIDNIHEYLQPLEDVIRKNLLPALLEGHECNDIERDLLALPPKFGGMGILNPITSAQREFRNSRRLTESLTSAIKLKNTTYVENQQELSKIKGEIQKEKDEHNARELARIKSTCDATQLKLIEASIEKGSYNWLTALPLSRHNYHLEKRIFWDTVRIRYNYPLKKMPERCVCSNRFDLEHALNCKKGGFISNRHNAVRDLTASLLQEICHDVEIEPTLECPTGENLSKTAKSEDCVRVDVAARSFWTKGQRAYFDVRVFNPLARTYRNQTLPKIYVKHEIEKKKCYNDRILQIDNGSFTPLVISAFGGMGRECQIFYSKLAEKLAEKRSISKADASTYIRTKLSFALVKATNLCIRGSRSWRQTYTESIREADIAVAVEEAAAKL